MHILHPSEYAKARPLFQALDDSLAVRAILEGASPGEVYVDDVAQPRAAFTWTGYRFFLAGSAETAGFNEAVRQMLVESIYPLAQASGPTMFELKAGPGGWDEAIETIILRDKHPIRARRHYYRFAELRHDWRLLLPQGFRIERITGDLLRQMHLRNVGELMQEMCSERPSVDDFLAKSFGVVPVIGNEIAGWCTSEYNTGDRCEVGIGTLEPYQRRGLATAVGSALVEQALSAGITQIGWHCWANNIPSIATALKIGFEKADEYWSYIAWPQRPML